MSLLSLLITLILHSGYRHNHCTDSSAACMSQSVCFHATARKAFSYAPDPLSDTVVRQRDKTYSCYRSRRTLNLLWDSVLRLMRVERARFLSDTTHCPMVTSESVCRTSGSGSTPLSKGGRGIFNVYNDVNACPVHTKTKQALVSKR